MLRRYCLACLVLSCVLRLRSVVAHAFNSIWRGVGFGCDPPPFGWFRVEPRSRPYSFGMIVGVASDRRAHLCTHLFARCLSTRALAHAYSLLWLARRSHGSCSLWDAVLGRRAPLSPCDCTPMHFISSGGSFCSAVNSVDARIACVACLLKCQAH